MDIKSGEFTLDSDWTGGWQTPYVVNHNIGSLPDMVAFWADDNGIYDSSVAYGRLLSAVCFTDSTPTATSTYGYSSYYSFCSANSTPGTVLYNANTAQGIANVTDTEFRIRATTSNPLKAGITYKWVAIKFA